MKLVPISVVRSNLLRPAFFYTDDLLQAEKILNDYTGRHVFCRKIQVRIGAISNLIRTLHSNDVGGSKQRDAVVMSRLQIRIGRLRKMHDRMMLEKDGILESLGDSGSAARFPILLKRLLCTKSSAMAIANASPQFFRRLESLYAKCELEVHAIDQDAASITKYVSRAAFKTSPFSQFTGVGAWNASWIGDGIELTPTSAIGSQKIAVQANNYVLQPLFCIAKMNESFLKTSSMQLNTSVMKEGERYILLQNFDKADRWSSIKIVPFTNFVVDALSNDKTKPFNELVQDAVDIGFGNSRDIEKVITQLVAADLIQPVFRLSLHLESWLDVFDAEACAITSGFPDLKTATMVLFGTLKTLRETYLGGSAADRVKDSSKVRTAYAEFIEQCKIAHRILVSRNGINDAPLMRNLETESLVYENCCITSAENFRLEGFKDHIDQLQKLFEDGLHLASETGADLREAERFARSCVEDGQELPMIDVFVKYLHASVQSAAQINVLEDVRKEARAAMSRFKALMDSYVRTRGALRQGHFVLDLTRDTACVRHGKRGYGFAFQKIEGLSNAKAVVNAFYTTPRRFYSRFYPLFSDSTREKLRIPEGYNSQIRADLIDSSFFNVNDYPPILEWEVATPGAFSKVGPERRLTVSDIFIRNRNGRITLFSKKHRCDVIPSPTTLEGGTEGGSKLFKFIGDFSPFSFQLATFSDAVTRGAYLPSVAGIKKQVPRIVLASGLVLERRKWFLDVPLLKRDVGIANPKRFRTRIIDWFLDRGMPMHFFLSTRGGAKSKPQYITLADAASTYIFRRSLLNANADIVITEALPAPGNSDEIMREYVLEFEP